MIADRVELPRRDEPTADILQLVRNWLCDEANGRWIMILDNANDHTVFSDPHKGRLKSDITSLRHGRYYYLLFSLKRQTDPFS